MSGSGQVISSDCSALLEAEQLLRRADVLRELTFLRKKSRYTLSRVDKGPGIILNAGSESDLKYSLATPFHRLAVSSRQPFPT